MPPPERLVRGEAMLVGREGCLGWDALTGDWGVTPPCPGSRFTVPDKSYKMAEINPHPFQ